MTQLRLPEAHSPAGRAPEGKEAHSRVVGIVETFRKRQLPDDFQGDVNPKRALPVAIEDGRATELRTGRVK